MQLHNDGIHFCFSLIVQILNLNVTRASFIVLCVCVCVNRLQRGGSSWSCFAPSCSAPAHQPQEGNPGLRFRRRSGSSLLRCAANLCQMLPVAPPNTQLLCRPHFAWRRPHRQSHLHFRRGGLEKRTIEEEEEEEARWPEALVPSGDCFPQNHRAVECFNSSGHTLNFIYSPTKKTTKTAGWNFIDFGPQVHETPSSSVQKSKLPVAL